VSSPDPTATKGRLLVSHAFDTAVTSADQGDDGTVPGLLEVLAQVPDPRKERGRRYLPTFVLAVACALAGVRNFREAGDHAAELPQDVLARLGGIPHPLLRRIIRAASAVSHRTRTADIFLNLSTAHRLPSF
jgi:hypothetical protein